MGVSTRFLEKTVLTLWNKIWETQRIQDIVKKNTGISIGSDMRTVEIYELDKSENIEAKLAELDQSGYRKK